MSFESQSFKCAQCPYVFKENEIDFTTKRATCPKCGKLTVFTRKAINSSSTVSHEVESAIAFFDDNNYDSAKRAAETALMLSGDNAVALFILAYYNAYHADVKTQAGLDKFFKNSLPEIDVDLEEMDALKRLLLKKVMSLVDYEEEILAKILDTQKRRDIPDFVEAFSPYTINKRGSIDWFTPKMIDIYTALTEKADIPKTWFALYKQISENHDSPEKANTFYLKTNTKLFFDKYVCGLERIFAEIGDPTWKAKFVGGLQKKKEYFISKMNN